jgi:hypothetical protein
MIKAWGRDNMREYKLDEVKKEFIVSEKNEFPMNLTRFDDALKTVNDELEANIRNKKIIEDSIKRAQKVPNKEKLIRHRKEHLDIGRLEQNEKFEQDLKITVRNIEVLEANRKELEEHKKLLENLVDKDSNRK